MNKIKIYASQNFSVANNYTGSINQYSAGKIVLLIPDNLSIDYGLMFSWITPGNHRVPERPMFRSPHNDEPGFIAFEGNIYPSYTLGVMFGRDSGHAHCSFRTGPYSTGSVRIPVFASIAPEGGVIEEDIAQELVREINELKIRVQELEAKS